MADLYRKLSSLSSQNGLRFADLAIGSEIEIFLFFVCLHRAFVVVTFVQCFELIPLIVYVNDEALFKEMSLGWKSKQMLNYLLYYWL
jgi:hypothetical protein